MKKLFLFIAAALVSSSMWAAQETATNTGSKDNALVGTSYTIAGTYIAGAGSTQTAPMGNKGVKVRTNRAATSDNTKSNVIEFLVNSNYKITSISLCGNSNTKGKAVTLGSAYIDGVEYTGSIETGSIVASDASSSTKVTTLTNIEATSAIIFTIADLNSTTQANIYYEITYEQLVECTDPEIAWDTEPANGEVGDADFVASVTTNPENHAVTWTSSVPEVATVTDGTIHYVGAGATAISASLTYTGDDFCKKTVSVSKNITVPISYETPGENDKVWYYQSAVPSSKPDNGLNYGDTKSGSGLYGVKLNSSGYAWFVKPAVAGTLRVGAYSPDLKATYVVEIYACDNEGTISGDALGTLSTPHAGGVSSTMEIDADVTGIYIKRQTNNEGILYFIEFRGEAPCAATAPGDISKGTLSEGNLTLTAAGSPVEGDTWYWQSAADGEDKTGTSGASKVVSAAGTYYIRSYNAAADCWSAAKSFTVTAIDLVANYTVIYLDGETELGRETVEVGQHPAGIEDPEKDCYTFAGWSPVLSSVSGNEDDEVEVNATWTPVYLTGSIDFEEDGNISGVASHKILASVAGEYDGGKESENWAYKGWKIKSAGATVKFLVPANNYLQFKFGYLDAAGTVTISGDETSYSVTGASKEAGNALKYTTYYWVKNYDAVYTFTTGNKNAAVIKAIKMTANKPTALDNAADEVKAQKFVENGQLYIQKDGKIYNVMGMEIR